MTAQLRRAYGRRCMPGASIRALRALPASRTRAAVFVRSFHPHSTDDAREMRVDIRPIRDALAAPHTSRAGFRQWSQFES